MSPPLPEEMSAEPATVESIIRDLRAIGVEPGQTVLVHSSLSAFGWVCGGAPTVVDALQRVITESGTVVMPTHSPGNRDPADMENPPVPESWHDTIREEMPPYRPALTPTQGMGAIPECFRNYPEVQRSGHPQHSFAAWGADAAFVITDHGLNYSLGDQSPLARIHDLDGDVLYLGTTHATCSSLHLAEYQADPSFSTETKASAVAIDGSREWLEWEDIDLDDQDFTDCGMAFEREQPDAVNTGRVGVGHAKLLDQPSLVAFGAEWFETTRE